MSQVTFSIKKHTLSSSINSHRHLNPGQVNVLCLLPGQGICYTIILLQSETLSACIRHVKVITYRANQAENKPRLEILA